MMAVGLLLPCLIYPNTTYQMSCRQHVDYFNVQALQMTLHHIAGGNYSRNVAIHKHLNKNSETQGYVFWDGYPRNFGPLLINRDTSRDLLPTNTLLFPIHYLAVDTKTPTAQSQDQFL